MGIREVIKVKSQFRNNRNTPQAIIPKYTFSKRKRGRLKTECPYRDQWESARSLLE